VSISLSIVIPSYNRPELLRECLRSVVAHAPAQTEILVVDDASPGRRVSQAAASFDQVKVIRLPRRRGFCAAANTGLRHVGGTIVELLNDDTEVTAGWADSALANFQDATIAAVAPLVLFWREPGQRDRCARIDSAGDGYYLGGVARKHGHGQLLGPGHLRRRKVFGASASSAFYRRDALVRVGAFPESFGAYFEDVDVAFRLHGAGYHIVYEPESCVYHRVSASYGQPQRRLLEQQSQNEERVFWRNLPAGALAKAISKHLAVLAGKAWRRWQEGTLAPYIWGRLRVLGEIRALLEHRRWLPSLQNLATWEVQPRYRELVLPLDQAAPSFSRELLRARAVSCESLSLAVPDSMPSALAEARG
jgi:GT2 family glycosyltransferase